VTRWPSANGGGSNWSPGLLDRAETFAESDVTLSHDKTRVSGESLELAYSEESSVSLPMDTTGYASLSNSGCVINPNNRLDGVIARVGPSGSVPYVEDARIVEGGTGDEVVRVNGTWEEGETVKFEATREAGTEYAVEAITPDKVGTDVCIYTYTSTDVDVTNGWEGGATSSSFEAWDQITAIQGNTSGKVTVEWPMPTDLAGWDIIPYEATEDGGTIEVYAIDPSDGTRLAGPIADPGDISGLSRSTNVAVEVVIERPSTSENPRLEAVYRRRKIT